MNLRREFRDRDDLLDYLLGQFPNAGGGLSPLRGGREAADKVLTSFPASRYAASRNCRAAPFRA